jgi:hypothetical protein
MSVLVLTSKVKSTLLPGIVGVGLFVVGDPVSPLPQAPRQEVITNEPALKPKAARKSLRSIIFWFNAY